MGGSQALPARTEHWGGSGGVLTGRKCGAGCAGSIHVACVRERRTSTPQAPHVLPAAQQGRRWKGDWPHLGAGCCGHTSPEYPAGRAHRPRQRTRSRPARPPDPYKGARSTARWPDGALLQHRRAAAGRRRCCAAHARAPAVGSHRRAGRTPARARQRPRRRSPRARCSPGRRLPRSRPVSPAPRPCRASAPCLEVCGRGASARPHVPCRLAGSW